MRSPAACSALVGALLSSPLACSSSSGTVVVRPDGPLPDGGGDAAPTSCTPRVVPRGVTALDDGGRILNARGIHLVDWDGFVANRAVTITLKSPPDIAFPATVTITANHPRLYFDSPSTTGATGPAKTVQFSAATTTVDVRVGIFPDRDGADEQYAITMTLGGADPRPEQVPVTVHDQDQNSALSTKILVDFSHDVTGLFGDPNARDVMQDAADDWAYFLADPPFDPVAVEDESTFIWNQDGFVSGTTVTNESAYTGFLLHAYGIHSSALRSGGEGSRQGKPQTSSGTPLPLRRSGGLEVETQGNYNTLGWSIDPNPDDWWTSRNQANEKNDLYSIVHHEMGHAHGFNGVYPMFVASSTTGISSPAIIAYLGHPIAIDASDHFAGTVDPDSGFGVFGNEYHGAMPLGRWVITRVDLLALQAIGYPLRPTLSFGTWQDNVPDCP